MQENLVQKMVAEVVEKLKNKGIENSEKVEVTTPVGKCECRLTEFVGLTTHGHGIGLVIANVDPALHEAMGLDKKYDINLTFSFIIIHIININFNFFRI